MGLIQHIRTCVCKSIFSYNANIWRGCWRLHKQDRKPEVKTYPIAAKNITCRKNLHVQLFAYAYNLPSHLESICLLY